MQCKRQPRTFWAAAVVLAASGARVRYDVTGCSGKATRVKATGDAAAMRSTPRPADIVALARASASLMSDRAAAL